jgi:hypothetical protein
MLANPEPIRKICERLIPMAEGNVLETASVPA